MLTYQQKLSGPLLDRIDLQVELHHLSIDEQFAETHDDESVHIRASVESAPRPAAEAVRRNQYPTQCRDSGRGGARLLQVLR